MRNHTLFERQGGVFMLMQRTFSQCGAVFVEVLISVFLLAIGSFAALTLSNVALTRFLKDSEAVDLFFTPLETDNFCTQIITDQIIITECSKERKGTRYYEWRAQ